MKPLTYILLMFAPLVMGQASGPATFDRTDMTFDMTGITFDMTTYRGSIDYEVKIIGGRSHLVYTVDNVTFINQLGYSEASRMFVSITGDPIVYRGICNMSDVLASWVIRGTVESVDVLDLYDQYLVPFGSNKTYSNADTISESEGALKGTFTVVDLGTGSVSLLNDHMLINGDRAAYDKHYIKGDSVTRVPGKSLAVNVVTMANLNRFNLGFAKSDFSNPQDGSLQAYQYYKRMLHSSDQLKAQASGSGYDLIGNYAEYQYVFLLGGFDSNGVPYQGTGDSTAFTYGGYLFRRGHLTAKLILMNAQDAVNDAIVIPWASAYEDRCDVKLMRMSVLTEPATIPQPYEYVTESDANVFNTNGEAFYIHAVPVVGTSSSISMKILLDDADTPLNYIEITLTRTTTVVVTVNQYIAGSPTLLATSAALGYVAGKPLEVWWEPGYMMVQYGGTYVQHIEGFAVSTNLNSNTECEVVNAGANRINRIAIWPSGVTNDDYKSYMHPTKYVAGNNPPGYGLPGETRKGWHFAIGSLCPYYSAEVTGALVTLTNGSTTMRVQYYDFYRETFITDLDFNVTLDYAYTGTSEVIAVLSDPHFGTEVVYENNSPTEILSEIVNPYLITNNITKVFLLGDLAHDNATYYTDIKAAMAVPSNSITWYTLTGNHDVIASWKTEFSQAQTYYNVEIGNINWILLGCADASNNIGSGAESFLGSELSGNQDINNMILTHAPRAYTVRTSDGGVGYHAGDSANIETAIGVNNFVAWFCGHTHGWANVKEPDNSVFLNLQ